MRSAYVHHDLKFLLCWTPKVACTSLAEWFAYGLLAHSPLAVGDDLRAWLNTNGFRVARRELAAYRDAGYHVVAFKRDPMARAVSAYVSKFVFKSGTPVTAYDQLEPFAKTFYRVAKGIDGDPPVYEGISFMEFLAVIDQRIASRGAQEPRLDHHFSTQVPFYWIEIGPKIDELFAVEAFEDGIDALNRRFGLSYVPGRLNSTPYAPINEDVSRVPSLELAMAGRIPSLSDLVNGEAAALIHRAYEIDYKTLGYSGPMISSGSAPIAASNASASGSSA
jgi:hypothetical protein